MRLNYRKLGDGPPLIVLHGLLGSMNNWQTLGMRLGRYFSVYLVDQRNHGRSPHTPDHNYPAMVHDVIELMDQENIASANLLGHSMGGKVAMQAVVLHPERFMTLTVVDIAPRAYEDGHRQYLEAMRDLDPATCATREEADAMLRDRIPDPSVRQFILTNLKRDEAGRLAWRVNLAALLAHQNDLLVPVVTTTPSQIRALFLRGQSSAYITSEDEQLIIQLFPRATIQTIDGAGHWVHADQPLRLEEALLKFLRG
jgi:esterase